MKTAAPIVVLMVSCFYALTESETSYTWRLDVGVGKIMPDSPDKDVVAPLSEDKMEQELMLDILMVRFKLTSVLTKFRQDRLHFPVHPVGDQSRWHVEENLAARGRGGVLLRLHRRKRWRRHQEQPRDRHQQEVRGLGRGRRASRR